MMMMLALATRLLGSGVVQASLSPLQTSASAQHAELAGRQGAAVWTDADANIRWVFGGRRVTPTFMELRDDLWRHNVTSRTWTWVAGGLLPSLSSYGAGGWPGSRQVACAWSIYGNATNGGGTRSAQHYMFGGFGMASTGAPGLLGDMWRFYPNNLSVTNEAMR